MPGFFPLLKFEANKFQIKRTKSIEAETCAAAALQLTSGIGAGWALKLVRPAQKPIKGTKFLLEIKF